VSRMIDADPSIVGQMIRLFLQLAPERLGNLRRAAQAQDLDALRSDARKMLGAAQTIAATSIVQSANSVEQAAARADWEEAIAGLQRLETEIGRLQRSAVSAPVRQES